MMNTAGVEKVRCTLSAKERLKYRKQIETLFQKGKAFSVFPIKAIHLCQSKMGKGEPPAKVGFVVPKKRIRKAVDRNRAKRLMREAWRLNKYLLYNAVPEGKQVHCFLVFVGNPVAQTKFASVEKAVTQILEKIAIKYSN